MINEIILTDAQNVPASSFVADSFLGRPTKRVKDVGRAGDMGRTDGAGRGAVA